MDEFKIPKKGDILKGTVVKVTQEEVLLDVGYMFEGTIYKDYLSREKVTDARTFCKVGDELEAEVMKLSHGDQTNAFLLSRVNIENRALKAKHESELTEKTIVKAKVIRSNPGGLELDYYGIRLFMPNSQIALKDQQLPNEEYIGKTLDVQVLKVTTKNGKEDFLVSHKQIQYDAIKAEEKKEYNAVHVGDVVTGKVTKILDFGAIISLSNHVDGLLHISECSHYHIKDASEVCSVGEEIKVKVIKIVKNKISLSIKALEKDPWTKFLETHKVGDKVEGTVVKKMQFGMLLEVEREVTGLLNRADYSWDPQDNLAGKVELGDKIEVEITSINKSKKQFSLSKKHLEYNPWADVKLNVGEIVSATVKETQEKGASVEIEGVLGFLPIGEISDDKIARVEDAVKVGDVLQVKILSVFPKEWKLVVSRKKIIEENSRKEYEDQLKENVSSNQSLADLFKQYKK